MSLLCPRSSMCSIVSALFCWFALLPTTGQAQESYQADVKPASDEAELSLRSIQVPDDLKLELFAAEPHVANIVAFATDDQGRLYVVETFRLHAGVTDIRGHMDWLKDDLACRTVADRVAKYRKYLGDKFSDYEKHPDRVRLIEDTDGDGKADKATVFAEGFDDAATGIAAGVLARDGNVWLTCIPDLWLLRDTNGDGKADLRKSLHHGYGVHTGFLGHDLHGLTYGPDGKIYFSIGDRGINVKTDKAHLEYPDMGTVLRCNPDGSDLEVFAQGLRNPQELAFDQYGNLFTVDNNSDGGDKARVVYVVEGGDSGWRIGYQFLQKPMLRGPWRDEKLWEPRNDSHPAYLLPPLMNLSDGPSGLAYYPGTGLPERYQDTFFLADFRGTPTRSGIRTFSVAPDGAGYKVANDDKLLWSVLATDVEFANDGGLYVSDWVTGWGMTGKGRIIKVVDPKQEGSEELAAIKKILAEGVQDASSERLLELLGHQDQRVRQRAQFELAKRRERAIPTLLKATQAGQPLLRRLHGLWGFGQVARQEQTDTAPIIALLADDDAEVRAQAARVLGDLRDAEAYDALVKALQDASPRVRFFAAKGLGKLGRSAAIEPLLAMLRENDNKDLYLRHAGAMALLGIGDRERLLDAAHDSSPAARLGVLLALRRMKDPEIARFLQDSDPSLVNEAALAIHDVPIKEALPALAALASRTDSPPHILRRVANANYRLGGTEEAARLAKLAANPNVPTPLRAEVVTWLDKWSDPPSLDPIVGLYRPVDASSRSQLAANDALATHIEALLIEAPEQVQLETARQSGLHRIKAAKPHLVKLAGDEKRSGKLRAEATHALANIDEDGLKQAANVTIASNVPELRIVGMKLMAEHQPEQAVPPLEKALSEGTVAEKQNAAQLLAGLEQPGATEALATAMDQLLAGKAPPEIHLELLEAARSGKSPALKERLERYEASLAPGDPVAPFAEALAGGDATKGADVFRRTETACARCHRIGKFGSDVGPELTDLGKREKRQHILESIVAPNAKVAKGFEGITIVTVDGDILTGVLKEENDHQVTIVTPKVERKTIRKEDIDERAPGKSAMPDDLIKRLSKSDLRDLVEYLARQKSKPVGPSGHGM
ncbi:Quinoprotein glucose dehydrogenase B precursor [Planctomycetes bacterium Pan216]|uniref:Quinoprotein glucose dehydrogenase B n=1 Tax=Kolteria novifilia TaxID=2527975 RepID=A0A518B6S5_9BACT|nr:Quinoprotein glucose dehydrogenase B precursor [Planctomycetes bacterium Pan216]